jgi:hypothetical protein
MNNITLEHALIAGVAALASVVGVLWKMVVSELKRIREKLDECEHDREKLWAEIAKR